MKSEDNQNQNQSFIREKVVKRGGLRRRLLWAFRMVLGGLLFGLAACLVFVCLKSWISPAISPTEETTEDAIVLPGDEPTTPEEPTTEADITTEAPTDEVTLPTSEAPTLSLEELIAAALEHHTLTMEDYRRLDQLMIAHVNECNRGIVTVAPAVSDGAGGWKAGEKEVAGALWMMTEKDGLILVDYSRLAGAERFMIKRGSEGAVVATLKAADHLTGIAVVQAQRTDLEAAGIFESDVLEPELSYSASVGQSVVMLGDPFGVPYSAKTGQIVYIESGVGDIDAEHLVLHSDIEASGGGFLVSLNGQILGMTTDNMGVEGESGSCFLALSDLRSTLENLANGRNVGYIGVRGAAVSQERSQLTGVPVGLYVSEVALNSPAYASGIQGGDVIVAIDDTVVTGMKELQAVLNRSKPNQVLKVRVMRQGKEAYVEQMFDVTAGMR